jgi:hypothetical protein
MATDKPTKPPLRRLNTRVDPWGNALHRPSTGSAASDVFPHLPSKMNAPPVKPTPKPKQGR